MGIVKAKDFIEVYGALSQSSNIHEMSGRKDRKYNTEGINNEIIKHMQFEKIDRVIDIGCGDGSLLTTIKNQIQYGLGINPTQNEILRLKKEYGSIKNIDFTVGLSDNLPANDNDFDKVILNSVLPILPSSEIVSLSLANIYRVAKPGASIWLGEVLNVDEMKRANKSYGDSISKWLWYLLRNNGFGTFWNALKQVTKSLITKEPFIISPKRHFIISTDHFIKLCEQNGLTYVKHFPHQEYNPDGTTYPSESRTDFIFTKK